MGQSLDCTTLEHARFLKQPGEPGQFPRWGVKGRKKCFPLLRVEAKPSTVREGLVRARERALKDELAYGTMRCTGSGLELLLGVWREPEVELGGSHGSF